jgi:lysophospholipase L1-like esterase
MKRLAAFLVLGCAGFLAYSLFFTGPEIRNATPSGENIIAFGDSLTYGTGATKGMDYPSQLSRTISRPVLNAGIEGDTTARALLRLEGDVLSRSPRIVFVTLGGNDIKNGVPREDAFSNLRIIVASIQEKGALVILGGIDVPFWGRGFGDAYHHLSEELGTVLVPNVLEGILGDRSLMSDSIHPNDDGYAIMAEKFYQAMKPYL